MVAPNRLVTSNDFTNDKGQELLGKVRVEFADRREISQTADLLGFPAGNARGQSVPGLQFADRVGTKEPLCKNRTGGQRIGATFWLRLKKLVGSYLVLSSTSRA